MELRVIVSNETGIHARPAKVLVTEAQKYISDITISNGERTVNCKSIIAVISLGITKGMEAVFNINGEDEESAYNAICELFKNNLYE